MVSAHRTPDWMMEYASTAESRGLSVIIAAAGGAAHLPGMVASKTLLPVLGVPMPATVLNGLDALMSIVQMPKGVPVGTLAIGKPGRRQRRAARRGHPVPQVPGAARAAGRLAAGPHRRGAAGPGARHEARTVLPGGTIGILGGGQLGRMMALAARTLGYQVQALDPDPACPARFVVDQCYTADFGRRGGRGPSSRARATW